MSFPPICQMSSWLVGKLQWQAASTTGGSTARLMRPLQTKVNHETNAYKHCIYIAYLTALGGG